MGGKRLRKCVGSIFLHPRPLAKLEAWQMNLEPITVSVRSNL